MSLSFSMCSNIPSSLCHLYPCIAAVSLYPNILALLYHCVLTSQLHVFTPSQGSKFVVFLSHNITHLYMYYKVYSASSKSSLYHCIPKNNLVNLFYVQLSQHQSLPVPLYTNILVHLFLVSNNPTSLWHWIQQPGPSVALYPSTLAHLWHCIPAA